MKIKRTPALAPDLWRVLPLGLLLCAGLVSRGDANAAAALKGHRPRGNHVASQMIGGRLRKPAVPAGLVGSATPNGAKLQWAAVAGADSYRIYCSTSAGAENADPEPILCRGLSYSLTDLADHTMEFCKVAAVERGVQSGLSAELAVMPTKINPVDGAEMIWIPAGAFTMGSDSGENNEKPAHLVTLDGYYIYKNLVTVAMYEKFCAATGRKMPGPPNWGWDNTDYPIVKVDWDDVTAYCLWADGALPTEAQWEKAARGPRGSAYPWGDDWNPNDCNAEATLNGPSPVGSYPRGASPYGVLDMAGNAWEWCADWYDPGYYAVSPTDNPTGPGTGSRRVIRGGGWFIDASLCRSTYRLSIPPADAEDDLGFRLVAGQTAAPLAPVSLFTP